QDWSVITYSQDTLFDYIANKLSDEQKRLVTLTSKPVSKDVLWNYLTNDAEAFADFHDRMVNLYADTNLTLETHVGVENSVLDHTPYQIIPIKKGSNKVIVKKGPEYLSGKEGTDLQYAFSIGDDEILELVPIQNSGSNEIQFDLINKNGARLIFTNNLAKFTTDKEQPSNLRFTSKNNNELHNWLVDWHPSKVNETKKHEGMTYAGLEFKPDEKDSSIWTAYNSGKLITNSWIERQGEHYYADSSGILLKGWQEFEGNTYYFSPNSNHRVKNSMGYVSSDTFIDGKWYNFNEDGVLQKSAWNGLEYADASGAFIKEGLKKIDNKIYYFKDYKATTNELRLEDQHIILHFSDKGVLEKASRMDGKSLSDTGTFVTLDEKKLVFEKDGAIRKTGVSKIYDSLFKKHILFYYSFEEGPFYTGWKEIDGKKYYFSSGKNYTFDGHEEIDGKRYYFNQDGEAKLTGFDKVNNKIYYYNNKGEMQTGWQEIDGKWYYFDESGAAKIGWFQVGGGYHFPDYGYFTYYAKEDGSIYTDTNVEINGKTYKFDSHGHKGY
ncbi:TPA: cell wall-binding protein, partial [Bacillus pseudomycoides]|nr:cell wall-binding protein [Bacillus pseudomycoides]